MSSALPAISVFTPTHDPTYLSQAWRSLAAQDFPDWQWVVLVDGHTSSLDLGGIPTDDDRITVIANESTEATGVGAAKQAAVSHCTGRILVELDHDDILERTCLSALYRAFQDRPDASLVYSTFTQITDDGQPETSTFGEGFGWRYRSERGGFLVPSLMEPTPHNVSLIWYAPNHVRAFTREAYEAAGGYDSTLTVLDDQDLMSRLYQAGAFVPIDRRLYRQRVHSKNTQRVPSVNARIQEQTWELYEKYLIKNLEAWGRREGLSWCESPEELDSSCVDEIYSHIRLYDINLTDFDYNLHEVMLNAHDALVPNGMLLIMVREYSFVNEHYFRAWASSDQAPFQISRLRTFEHEGEKWVQANLIAVKEGYVRNGGYLANRRFLGS